MPRARKAAWIVCTTELAMFCPPLFTGCADPHVVAGDEPDDVRARRAVGDREVVRDDDVVAGGDGHLRVGVALDVGGAAGAVVVRRPAASGGAGLPGHGGRGPDGELLPGPRVTDVAHRAGRGGGPVHVDHRRDRLDLLVPPVGDIEAPRRRLRGRRRRAVHAHRGALELDPRRSSVVAAGTDGAVAVGVRLHVGEHGRVPDGQRQGRRVLRRERGQRRVGAGLGPPGTRAGGSVLDGGPARLRAGVEEPRPAVDLDRVVAVEGAVDDVAGPPVDVPAVAARAPRRRVVVVLGAQGVGAADRGVEDLDVTEVDEVEEALRPERHAEGLGDRAPRTGGGGARDTQAQRAALGDLSGGRQELVAEGAGARRPGDGPAAHEGRIGGVRAALPVVRVGVQTRDVLLDAGLGRGDRGLGVLVPACGRGLLDDRAEGDQQEGRDDEHRPQHGHQHGAAVVRAPARGAPPATPQSGGRHHVPASATTFCSVTRVLAATTGPRAGGDPETRKPTL